MYLLLLYIVNQLVSKLQQGGTPVEEMENIHIDHVSVFLPFMAVSLSCCLFV